LRVILPSVTKQPPIVPALGILNTWRTSALPISFSRVIGASMPTIAFFTSSMAS
jgi:hypothetical protein